MSWWNAKYRNGHGEYEITFASKDYEKTKAVEKLCQAIIDQKVKSPDDLPPYISGKDTDVRTNADRIRAMSDEELAKTMCDVTCPENMCDKPCDETRCQECWLEYLKQPTEEEPT